jgi:hypothetical protein
MPGLCTAAQSADQAVGTYIDQWTKLYQFSANSQSYTGLIVGWLTFNVHQRFICFASRHDKASCVSPRRSLALPSPPALSRLCFSREYPAVLRIDQVHAPASDAPD